ncbi:CgeB family protein [Leptothoe sp. PORK10 BA2]|uniref:CgeB family protein n=1 Tax=Leptothoe sp. PORK10 BA2 TaxID=3110254 RepID=UPI002B1F6552|nr:glycosyltransferase [Leptothoe sp. PORK10 BA2]MEA5466502.1 glycosyltransferase [Leptothoe sp. PORK10 BA2]
MNVVTILCNDFWMKNHLIKTWEHMANQVFNFFYPGMAGWHRGDWLTIRQAEGQRLLEWLDKIIANHSVDLIFCIGYDDFFTPDLCKKIKQHNIPLVNYHPDSDTQWYRCLRSASYFDLIGVAYKDYLKELAALTEVVYLPMAANCQEYFPQPVEKVFDVMFVGGYSLERERVMSAVGDVTPNVIVYGQRWDKSIPVKDRITVKYPVEKYINDFVYYLWPRLKAEGTNRIFKRREVNSSLNFNPYCGQVGGYLSDDDFVATISQAKIVIGINQRFGVIGSKEGYVSGRLRDFEIPACGAFYMAQRYPELDIYYREGDEIEMWSSIAELKAKVDYYLRHEQEILKIAKRAREKVLRDHTWEHRFSLILKRLGLKSCVDSCLAP